MHSSFKNVLVLIILANCLLLTSAAMGQGGRKPERDDGPATALTEVQKVDLAKAWVDQKRPTISLFVGYFEKGGPEFKGTSLENQLRTKIQSMMTSAPGLTSAIILPDIIELQKLQQGDAIKGNVAPLANEAIAGILRRQSGNARIAIVVLLQADGPGMVTVSLNVRDLRNGRLMGGEQYIRMNETTPDIAEVLKFSTALVVKIGEVFRTSVMANEQGRPVQLRLLGLRNNEEVDALTSMLLDGKNGIVSVSAAADRQGKATFAEFEVFYAGETRNLVRLIRDSLKDKNQSLRQIQTKDDFVLAEILSSKRPAWCQLTDTEDPAFAEKRNARLRALRKVGAPRVAVVVGSDLADPVAEFTDPQFEKSHGATVFRHSELARQIEDWMTDLGFKVVGSDPLRAKIADRLRQADRFADGSKLADALRNDMPDFDVILYVNIAPVQAGAGFCYSAQLVSWQDATIVGSQRWPDSGFDTFDECRIDPTNVKEVSRYLVGNLVERWDRFAERRGENSTLQVVVKQIDNVNNLPQIMDLFRSMSEVSNDGIDRVNVSGAVASFDVTHTGRPGQLVQAFIQKIGALNFPIHVEGQSEFELVLNLGIPKAKETPEKHADAAAAGKDILSRKARPIPNSWVLLIGINYKGDPLVSPLQYCVRDARLMYDTLTQRAGYPADRVVMMTDDLEPDNALFPTGRNIMIEIDKLGRRVRAGDQVLIHFSGHGSTPVVNGNAVLDEPSLAARSFNHEGRQVAMNPKLSDIREALRKNQAGQIILTIDACHAGGADRGLAGTANRPNAPLDALYAALAANNQSMITLAGSRLNQYSLESPEHKHGYFTYFVAQGLTGLADTEGGNRDGKVTFDELFGYVSNHVSKATNRNQQPFMSAAVIDRPVLADYSE
ncbi:MAG: caspase family protein [Bythopirellula sp.]|nr:caspase family protein [Bythopirellula sp.]